MNSECPENAQNSVFKHFNFQNFAGGITWPPLPCMYMWHTLRYPYAEHLSDFWLDPPLTLMILRYFLLAMMFVPFNLHSNMT